MLFTNLNIINITISFPLSQIICIKSYICQCFECRYQYIKIITQYNPNSISLNQYMFMHNKYPQTTALWQTFKTELCKKCNTSNHNIINFACPFYHSNIDRRRNPFNEQYISILLEDDYDPKHCLNIVQYLYHPDNYKREKCQTDCKKQFIICPYYHNSKEMQQKVQKSDDYSIPYLELEKILAQTNEAQTIIASPQNQLEILENNVKDISSINEYNKSQIFQYKQTQFYYQASQVDFHEDRHHEFKHFQQINFTHHIPLAFQYMCAFVNAEGGTLYIGIDDNAFVRGIRLSNKEIDKMLLQIDNGSKTRFTPPLLPQKYKVQFVKLKNSRSNRVIPEVYVVEIHVEKSSGDPYLYNREYYMRMNASTHRLLAAQIIEIERLKNQQKLSKGVQFQKAIMNSERKYFEKLSLDQLIFVKDKLDSATQQISRLIATRNN